MKASEPTQSLPIPDDTPEYRRGRWAFFDGMEIDDCPYRSGNQRRGWMAGWLDARTEKKFPHLFN